MTDRQLVYVGSERCVNMVRRYVPEQDLYNQSRVIRGLSQRRDVDVVVLCFDQWTHEHRLAWYGLLRELNMRGLTIQDANCADERDRMAETASSREFADKQAFMKEFRRSWRPEGA